MPFQAKTPVFFNIIISLSWEITMKPDDATIEKYQKIYFEEFNERISRKEAYESFLNFINVMRVVLHADTDDQDVDNPDIADGLDDKP